MRTTYVVTGASRGIGLAIVEELVSSVIALLYKQTHYCYPP